MAILRRYGGQYALKSPCGINVRIIIQDPPNGGEENVIFNVKNMTDNVLRAIEMLKSAEGLTVYAENQALVLPMGAVFYVESVENKTFVYAEKSVYRSRLKLYEVEELLTAGDFLRISKQVLVNVRKINSIAPAGEGRFIAQLVNGEQLIISRQYVPALKGRFGL
ncbi:MAG: LytTR family transcriptional regulator [Defluviitaleaceae bacterium]|nr:LytTR family transcriptional regulator [Defluviitaleaceae bacterium]